MSYTRTGLNLSASQKESIKKTYMSKKQATLRLTASQLSGNDFLGLTKIQHKKLLQQEKI